MKQKAAELLFEELESICCGENVSLRTDYSGRCMYGAETHAISGDFSMGDVVEAVGSIFMYDQAQENGLKPSDFRFTTDNMGLGIVIY